MENTKEILTLGIDVGSTTVKTVLMRGEKTLFRSYERHFAQVREKTVQVLKKIKTLTGEEEMKVAVSGSAGMGLSLMSGLEFIQEVAATSRVVKKEYPDVSCAIELGGEDAKILFFEGGTDERMNGTCAGGTGAFIDQMAALLNVSLEELNELSKNCKRLYPIASRCGVFAKSDIQPLINQGALKEDLAASIFGAVVNQTITGLAQGRKISGKVLFLGGPLYYLDGLRLRFKKTLKLEDDCAICPDFAIYCVAYGASLFAKNTKELFSAGEIIEKIQNARSAGEEKRLPALFSCESEYEEFKKRHSSASVKRRDISEYSGNAYLGIDCGSTTTKLVLISEEDELLYSYYASNKGDPVNVVLDELKKLYALTEGRIKIASSAVTGYGEELILHAFKADRGVVETIAHFTAAKRFMPDVEFILDIGGQDIKCFKIKNGAVDSIMLNEACSSGCGSFLETFAGSMGLTTEEFSNKALFASAPVSLGSRCTVFMNSSVKQAQKEGADVCDICAGLCVSVVKNAVYKVIRAADISELGKNIVVQGGTFYNDAVLRAFEKELNGNVVRPDTAGLMGAYGAALISKKNKNKSTLLSKKELSEFTHTAKNAVCRGCENNCRLTVNTFSDGEKYISGNRCEKALGLKGGKELANLYEFKRNYLSGLDSNKGGTRGKIGLPLALGMYELLPLWNGIFTSLGFETVVSGLSTHETYLRGQFTIPSDTACYPAKLMHGHVLQLIDKGVDAVFYPCLTYNVDERLSDNHYNCPVVAYYSELLNANIEELGKTRLFYPYLNINSKRELSHELYKYFSPVYGFKMSEIKKAVKTGFIEYERYMSAVKEEGERAVFESRKKGVPIMILAGRPYHVDPEVSHGIDKLINSLGYAVVSEDSVCDLAGSFKPEVSVLNQWTYHSRMYRAAEYAVKNKDAQMVQLVSFGCGVDAITTDEVRSILEKGNKLYTQIKIDEITNLGAVKIRLRSLIGALPERTQK